MATRFIAKLYSSIIRLIFSDNTTVFIFLLKNGASQENNSRELLCFKLNGEFKNIFYLGKNHWRTIFFFKNIEVSARTHATVKAENYFCIEKYAPLLTVATY